MGIERLPVETIIEIASSLPDDRICLLASFNRYLHNAVTSNSSSLWRNLFLECFDNLSTNLPNNEIRKIYQQRKKVLKQSQYTTFTNGLPQAEKEALNILRDLIVESFGSNSPPTAATSKNVELLKNFSHQSDLMANVLEPNPKYAKRRPLLIAVQILLSFVSFDLRSNPRTFGFQQSQIKVYGKPHRKPIFSGRDKTELDLKWVLDGINFFKHYMTVPHAALENVYRQLTRFERVRPWSRKLIDGAAPLGKSWRGAYAYLEEEEIDAIRGSNPPDNLEDRWCDNADVFQTLDVDALEPDSTDMAWPKLFEYSLRSRSHPSVEAARKRLASLAQQHHLELSSPGSGTNPQNRPKTTRAQLKQDPKAVLDDGPETSGTANVVPAKRTSSNEVKKTVASSNTTPMGANAKPPSSVSGPPVLLPFMAQGLDEETFLASGYTSALPPQQGIPGWQRFTMVKFFMPEDWEGLHVEKPFSMREIADQAVRESSDGLWAYEGVVLPGGNIIVGRWWSLPSGDGLGMKKPAEGQSVYSGPFLWWCVDPPPA